jgi:hypothetical protein
LPFFPDCYGFCKKFWSDKKLKCLDNVGANALFKPDGFLQNKKCFSEKNVWQIKTMQGNNEVIVEFHNSIKGTMHFLRF